MHRSTLRMQNNNRHGKTDIMSLWLERSQAVVRRLQCERSWFGFMGKSGVEYQEKSHLCLVN